MAEFKEVMKQFKRMCNEQKWCDNCQIIDNRGRFSCSRWLIENPTKAEEIIMRWAAEHPIKTNGMKFNEVFGFDLDALYGISEAAIKWFNEEYKGGQE